MGNILLTVGYFIYAGIVVGLIREYLDKRNLTDGSTDNYPTEENDDEVKRLIQLIEDCYYSSSSTEKEVPNVFATSIPAELLMDITQYILQHPVSLQNTDFRDWLCAIPELCTWLKNQPQLSEYLKSNKTHL